MRALELVGFGIDIHGGTYVCTTILKILPSSLIIGPTTILTAAHCVEASGLKPKDVKILVSEHDVRTDQETFS